MNPVRIAIVGASGYSGEDLVRILLRHPYVDITTVTSRQYAGQVLADVFPKFAHLPKAKTIRFDMPDPELIAKQSEFAFLALPHGVASEIAVPLLALKLRIIDLSADFRLSNATVYEEFYGYPHPAPELLSQSVYGLPECYRNSIKSAQLVASPGCYPTSILIPLLPLVKAGLVRTESIVVNSLSGVSGAGRKLDMEYLFVECNESMRPYGIPKHRHLSEIEQELTIAAGKRVVIQFTPHLIPVTRGMITSICVSPCVDIKNETAYQSFAQKVATCYQSAYAEESFIRILSGKALPDTKNIASTNMIEMAWRLDKRLGNLILTSALDNLTKGAGGQAIQSFNLMAGFPETTGLM